MDKNNKPVTKQQLDQAVSKLATKAELNKAVSKLVTKKEFNDTVSQLATKHKMNKGFQRLETKIDQLTDFVKEVISATAITTTNLEKRVTKLEEARKN